jgi:hypothetical protein
LVTIYTEERRSRNQQDPDYATCAWTSSDLWRWVVNKFRKATQ